MGEDLPRHFSLNVSDARSMAVASPGMEVEGADEAAVALQARLPRGLRSAVTDHSTSTKEGMASHSSGRHKIACNSPVYLVTHAAWLVVWIMVIYHYRFQKRQNQRMSTPEMVLG